MKAQYLIALAALSLAATQAVAGDAAAGEQVFNGHGCIGCHGPAGASANPDLYPVLKGKDEAYIVTQLKAFKDGSRSNPLMSPMAAGLNDDDVANVAAYLSAQK